MEPQGQRAGLSATGPADTAVVGQSSSPAYIIPRGPTPRVPLTPVIHNTNMCKKLILCHNMHTVSQHSYCVTTPHVSQSDTVSQLSLQLDAV